MLELVVAVLLTQSVATKAESLPVAAVTEAELTAFGTPRADAESVAREWLMAIAAGDREYAVHKLEPSLLDAEPARRRWSVNQLLAAWSQADCEVKKSPSANRGIVQLECFGRTSGAAAVRRFKAQMMLRAYKVPMADGKGSWTTWYVFPAEPTPTKTSAR